MDIDLSVVDNSPITDLQRNAKSEDTRNMTILEKNDNTL